MPYEPSSPSIAVVAKQLPYAALRAFCAAANMAEAAGADGNDCIRSGWAAVVRKNYVRTSKGPNRVRWVKADIGPSDVHVDTIMGSDGKPKKKKPVASGAKVEELTAPALKADGTNEKTLYVMRPLLNGDDVRAWAATQGFVSALPADDMHVTIAFSKKTVDWDEFEMQTDTITVEGGAREVTALGEGAAVLVFESADLTSRWAEFVSDGASWDYPEYHPHVTITYAATPEQIAAASPYTGSLVFGPEVFSEIDLSGSGTEFSEEPLMPNTEKTLPADASVSDYIHDFVHSTDKRFDGKSKDERVQMALGAFYSKSVTTEKAGARHSKADMEMLQTMHDHAVKLGASCDGVAKFNENHDDRGRFAGGGNIPGDTIESGQTRDELLGYARTTMDDKNFTFEDAKEGDHARVGDSLIRDALAGKVKIKLVPTHAGVVGKVSIIKLDDEQRMVWGWANIITDRGEPVMDLQGDIIEPVELEKSTTEFMKDVRVHAAMHRYEWVLEGDDLVQKAIQIGTVVHSLPLTYGLAKLLGIDTDVEGWIVGVYVSNDVEWAKYKDGTYQAFSIGGRSEFHPADEAALAA